MSLTEKVNVREEKKFDTTNNETDAEVVSALLSAVKEIVAEATTDLIKNDQNDNSKEKTTTETSKEIKDDGKEGEKEAAIKNFNDAVKENQELTKILTEMLEKPLEVKTKEEDEISKEKHEEKATEMLVTAVGDIAHDQIENKQIGETVEAIDVLTKAFPAAAAAVSDIINDHVEKTEIVDTSIHETEEATEVLIKAATTAHVSDIIHDHVEKTEIDDETMHETEKALLTAVADITHDHKEKTEADDSLKEEKLVQKINDSDLDVEKIVEEHEMNSIETKIEELQELSKDLDANAQEEVSKQEAQGDSPVTLENSFNGELPPESHELAEESFEEINKDDIKDFNSDATLLNDANEAIVIPQSALKSSSTNSLNESTPKEEEKFEIETNEPILYEGLTEPKEIKIELKQEEDDNNEEIVKNVRLVSALTTMQHEQTPPPSPSGDEVDVLAKVIDASLRACAETIIETEEAIVDQDKKDMYRNIAIIYNLSDAQFELVYEFFTNKPNETREALNKSLIQKLMSECLKGRAQVYADENDVDRSLSALSDDSTMNFEEFIRYLSLFFASKQNLAERVQYYLNFNHSESDTMLDSEAAAFAKFLKTFFGVDSDKVEEEEKSEIGVAEFVNEILPQLESKAFVKWETE